MSECTNESTVLLTATEARRRLTGPLVPLEDLAPVVSTPIGKAAVGAAGTYLLYRLVVPQNGGLAPTRPEDYDGEKARKPWS